MNVDNKVATIVSVFTVGLLFFYFVIKEKEEENSDSNVSIRYVNVITFEKERTPANRGNFY